MPLSLLLALDVDLGVTGSGSLTLLIVYVALAIGVSFLCSIMEAVLLSVTPAYIGALEVEKPVVAARIKTLKAEIDRPLAAILTLNTVAHTIGAAGAGAEAAAYFGNAAVGLFSALLTLGILILSEIIPKTLGAVYWRSLAGPVSRLLRPLIWGLYPLVVLSQWITKLIARGKKEGDVSRDEVAALATIGEEQGVFEAQEARILRNLLRFNDLKARDVMTPRTVLVSFPETTTAAEVAAAPTAFSRLPVYAENRDRITGYVLKDDVLAHVADDEHNTRLSALAREIMTVSEDLPLPRVFDRLLDRREHIALVVGEYGGTQGIVTMEDVIETLLGLEIVDEADHTTDMQILARERWRQRAERLGLLPIAGSEAAQTSIEREAAIQYGLTGGEPPPTEPEGEA
jgi:CBS domain containing-hemolysin-like protein